MPIKAQVTRNLDTRASSCAEGLSCPSAVRSHQHHPWLLFMSSGRAARFCIDRIVSIVKMNVGMESLLFRSGTSAVLEKLISSGAASAWRTHQRAMPSQRTFMIMNDHSSIVPAAKAHARATHLPSAEEVTGATTLQPDTDVETAIHVACALCNRIPGPEESKLAERLRENWFFSALDIASMSEAQAAAIKCPMRLKTVIAEAVSMTEDEKVTGPAMGKSSLESMTSLDMNGSTIPILERVCPPLHRFGHRLSTTPKVVPRNRITKYALSYGEMPSRLRDEFSAMHRFGTESFFGAQVEPIAEVTAFKYADHCRGMLGWLHTVQGVPLSDLSLQTLVPSCERTAVGLTFDYIQWLKKHRKISPRTELLVLRSILFAAKFLYHDRSKVRAGVGDKPYSDLDVVKELRVMIATANKAAKISPRVADEDKKWLDWPEYLMVCNELLKECAGRNGDGSLRERKDIAWSLQKFLIFAILACIPDRQRTLRELEVGRTLVKDGAGRWLVKHGPEDYKTGRSYGERPPLLINNRLYGELESFVYEWRAELNPSHNLLFTQKNGQPFTDKQLYKLFWTTAYRITGKRCTPHLVRDSIVTYLRSGHATERELEALALFMGHSLEMQRSSYDRRTKEQKVEPAVALLNALNSIAVPLAKR